MKNNILLLIIFGAIFTGCYSFRGGLIPEHLKTLQIQLVTDNSNFGNPEYKIDLETEINNNFIKDNSFELLDNDGDAKLTIIISSIIETTNAVSPECREELSL